MSYEENKMGRETTDADYDKAETDLLLAALKRSYKERFLFLMTLIKIQGTMQKMNIRHFADSPKKA